MKPVQRTFARRAAPAALEGVVSSSIRPVLLAWRKAPAGVADAGEGMTVRASSSMPPPSKAHAAPKNAITETQRRVDVRASDATALRLDTATVDRVADEVIRRVERRARIERERRGL
jgi:hypothetical protein